MISPTDFARGSLVLIIALSTALSCAGPMTFGLSSKVSKIEIENWHELRSPDFVLYSRGSTENLEALALDLARYVAVVERLVQSRSPKAPAQIFLVEGRAETLLIPDPNTGGYMGHSLGGFGGFMRSSTHDPENRHVLLHEYSHYLNLRSRGLKYPTWYEEGFAEFLGSTRTRDDVMEIGSAPRQNLLWLEYRRLRKEAINLDEIFSFERGGDRNYPRDFYPISWAVVHYLSSNVERQRRMVSMLSHQGAGLHWKRAYDRSFSEPIELLSSKIDRHAEMLSRGTPSAVSYLPLDSLDVRDDWKIRELSPTEILRLLGEMALRGSVALPGEMKANRQLAEALFRRVSGLDPGDSESRAGLASALSRQSRFDVAEIQLAAFRSDPEPTVAAIVHAATAVRLHAVSLTQKSDIAASKRLHASAIRLYRRALESQPNNPFALAGLGTSQLDTKDFEAARQSLSEAESVGEWDADLALNQGRVEQQLGFITDAKAFWSEVVRLGTEDEAKRAAALLDEVGAD